MVGTSPTRSVVAPGAGQISGALKSGQRPVQESVRVFKAGEVLFKQGERGRELFILKEGEIAITLGEREDAVELARLGGGAILGEMALLDGAPRSANATAINTTKALVINELVFNAVSQTLPVWLRSIIKIITSRLRDSNKFIGHSILRNREKGVSALLVLLLREQAVQTNSTDSGSGKESPKTSQKPLDYWQVVEAIQFSTRLKRGDAEKNLALLAKRRLIEIKEGEAAKKWIHVPDPQILDLFIEFHALKEEAKSIPELQLVPDAVSSLPSFQKLAGETPLVLVQSESAWFEAVKKHQSDFKSDNLKILLKAGLFTAEKTDKGQAVLRLSIKNLKRAIKVHQWISNFTLEV